MEETSQKSSVWRERWWFIARLFTAWTVITVLSGAILNPLGWFIHMKQFEMFLDVGSQTVGWPILQYIARSIYYFISGYVAFVFFKEHWVKVGLGIPAISFALTLWHVAWRGLIMPSPAEGLISMFLSEPARLPSLLSLLSPFLITAGVMARRYLPPSQIKPLIRSIRRWN